jgi:DNA-binding HxlR family transcriptional regulator
VPKQYGQACPVAKSLEFLGERWTLLIVRDLFSGPKKFHDLLRSLKGVAPGVLSHRLKVLEDHTIIARRMYSEHPPRAEYTLSERGLELRPVVRALAIWGGRHLEPGPVLVHNRCETRIEMAYYCPACNELITANAASYRGTAADAGDTVRRRPAGSSASPEPAAPDRTRPRRAVTRPARRSPTPRRSIT